MDNVNSGSTNFFNNDFVKDAISFLKEEQYPDIKKNAGI